MPETCVNVSFFVTFKHDGSWGNKDIQSLAEDLVGSEYSNLYDLTGISEWGVEHLRTHSIMKRENSDEQWSKTTYPPPPWRKPTP